MTDMALVKNALNYFIEKEVDILLCLDCATNDVESIKEAMRWD